MSTPVVDGGLTGLFNRHAELEERYGDGDDGRFLSGWQCENPWIDQIRTLVDGHADNLNAADYMYVDKVPELKEKLKHFHWSIDDIAPPDFICGSGSSSIIFTFGAWLRQQNVSEVYYIPPLYFTLHFALRLFGIRARSISGRQAFEPQFSINLPSERTILLVCDPIWYAGVSLGRELIHSLIEWQNRTGSLVFVDGSFQYTSWTTAKAELSALFDPARTVRLICPTKSLASHAYRFAYASIPSAMHAPLAHLYACIYGSSSMLDMAFASVAPDLIQNGRITRLLMDLAQHRHRLLRDTGRISAPWQPNTGYFVFEEIHSDLPQGIVLMDGSYFEQKRYPTFRRVNLLSPSLHLLEQRS